MAARIEILISGFGGQGVVRIGQILGQAAVNQGLYTTMLISHGTETRGGYVRSQVVISDAFIDSPVVENPAYFCAFSPIAYGMFMHLCNRQTLILHNPDLVTADPASDACHRAIAGETLAERELGNAQYANVLYLGVLSAHCGLLVPEHIVTAIRQRLPERSHENNIRAFELGREYTL